MSGDFLSQADLWAWVYELTKVRPGDYARFNEAHLPSPEATPTFPLLCSTHKCREGVEL